MFELCSVLFGMGLFAYAIALLNMGSVYAEILSDAGNGIMLSTAVLLLLNLTRRCGKKETDAPESQP